MAGHATYSSGGDWNRGTDLAPCYRTRHRRLRVTVRNTFQELISEIRAVQRSSAINMDGLAIHGGQAVTTAVNTLREVNACTLNKLTDPV